MFRRLLAISLTLAAAVGLFNVVNFPTLRVGETAKPQIVEVKPKKPTLICPGPIFVNGGANGVTLGSFARSGSVKIAGNNPNTNSPATASTEIVVPGSESGSKVTSGIQVQLSNTKQSFGLAAANCLPGISQGWLVAGDNNIGRETLLVLANSSGVDATVAIQIFGTSGPIQGAGLSGISAPAHKVTVLPLAAFAPKAQTFSVEVTSRGAELGMWLQQKTVKGLNPTGLDLIGLSASPSKRLELPGLEISGAAALSKIFATDPTEADLKPVLRITSTGDKATNFTAQIQGSSSGAFGTVVQGTIPAKSTRDFSLEELTDGDYAIHIDASAPVVASVRFSRSSGKKTDFAWAPAVAATKLDAGLTAPIGVSSKLSLVNSSSKATQVFLNARTISLLPNSSAVVSLTAGTSYSLKSAGLVSASQLIEDQGTIAVVPIQDYRTVGGQLNITVR